MKPSDEGCATTHRPTWGPLHPNEIGRVAQRVREGKRRKYGRDAGNRRPVVHGLRPKQVSSW